jgi:hypothetical protein
MFFIEIGDNSSYGGGLVLSNEVHVPSTFFTPIIHALKLLCSYYSLYRLIQEPL